MVVLQGSPGKAAADVPQHEAQRTPDRRRSTAAMAEGTFLDVEPELFNCRTADDNQRRARMRRRLHAIEIEPFLEHRLDRSDHDRHVLRLAARHHAVDRDFFDGRNTVARRHHADDFPGIALEVLENALDRAARRRHDRQTVGPFFFETGFDRRFEIGGFDDA